MTRLAAALLVLVAGCGGAGPGPAAEVRYALRLRDGGTTSANVAYLLPDGERREEAGVTVPWQSEPMTFPAGAVVFLSAASPETGAVVLLCVLQSADPAKGAYVGGRDTQQPVLGAGGSEYADCASEYRLGAWPPPEDNPETGNLMIRVG